MKTLLKIAALVILAVIAIKIAFGLLALVFGLIIPIAILALIGLIVWKFIDGKAIWQKLTNKKQFSTVTPAPPDWQMDIEDDLKNYEFPNQSLEHKKANALKH